MLKALGYGHIMSHHLQAKQSKAKHGGRYLWSPHLGSRESWVQSLSKLRSKNLSKIKRKIETNSEVQTTEADMVVHAFDPRTWKVEASKSAVEDHRQLA